MRFKGRTKQKLSNNFNNFFQFSDCKQKIKMIHSNKTILINILKDYLNAANIE